jgi:hypothetical protein
MSPIDPQPPKRNIDERIDALAKYIELHAAIMRDMDAKLIRLAENDEKSNARIDKLTKAIEIDAQNIRALASIAEAHQHRIQSLEGDQSAL